MADRYIPQEIEKKWQEQWEAEGLYRTVEDPTREKFYFLTMLPYTSGDLHMGHWYAMTPSDAAARYRRMKGYNVFFPIGFDAFGLPAENAAIRNNIHPWKWTKANVENMRRQLRSTGAMWAWDREAVSSDPRYYRWTQWFFLKLYDMGLAYRKEAAVDFCPHCNTTLAREQVWGDDRHCERCGTPVIRKNLEQWFFRITNYAEELLDFSQIDWPEPVRTMQTNWIGRSEGADVDFTTEKGGHTLRVFTTRPDTLWGATFMVLAPEHPLVEKLTTEEQRAEVQAYVEQTVRQTDIQREAADREKTGAFIGAYAINPVNNTRIPIWIADYVLTTYGTGAIMAVPAHDERDFEFALKFGLPVIPVIQRPDGQSKSLVLAGSMKESLTEALQAAGISYKTQENGNVHVTMDAPQAEAYIELARKHLKPGWWNEVVGGRWIFIFEDGVMPFDSITSDRAILEKCQALESAVGDKRTVMEMLHGAIWYRDVLFHAEYGDMIHSSEFSGTPGDAATEQVTRWLEKTGKGKHSVNYRLRDWLISRQRYWGAPIPMIYCPVCGIVPVPYEDLPVLLPEDAEFLPTGESPLKYHEGFRNVKCPQCGGDAERETDTMDTFMCSSWYHCADVTPYWKADEPIGPDDTPWNPEQGKYWLPVDQYTGGIEHATMHLIYTRFFTKAMRDMGLVDFDEPMQRLFNQGIILGEDSEKMSKSRPNVVGPDDLVARYGADTVRAYLMFIGPWEQGGPWNSQGIEGIYRFLSRVWSLVVDESEKRPDGQPSEKDVRDLQRIAHQTIRKVTTDIEHFRFNTMISALMTFSNRLMKARETAIYGTPTWDEALDNLLLLMAPSMPHAIEELWQRRHPGPSVHVQQWPEFDPEIAKETTFTLIVQINGKVRDKIEVSADIGEDEAKEKALNSGGARRHVEGKEIVKVIYVGGKLVNIVVKG